MEIAHLFSTFGTKVYIAEPSAQILPTFDAEVGQLLASDAKAQRGMKLLTQTKVVAVQKDGLQRRITYVQGGHEYTLKVDALLVASGRTAATDLGLENAGVKYTNRGISVNSSLQTSARHIFAAGGVVAPDAQTHSVLTHSRIAAHNLLHRTLLNLDDQPQLRVAYTQPQIAQTGLTETECKRRGRHIRTAIAPLTLTARSNITDERTGFVKLISDKKGVLIGATIVAPHASDMIAQLTLAIRTGLTAKQLMGTPNCFTAWSEAVRIAAGKLL